ncbi:MAG: transketolase [Pararhizobium sp.]
MDRGAGPDTRRMANALRMLAAEAVEAAGTGHPGMPLGMADIAAVLFTQVLKYDAAAPDWAGRDRFVLSNGHGSMLLYGLLYLTGSPHISIDDIRRFRKAGSKAAAHPEFRHPLGVETTTGPLGQGVANAVGMALAERLMNGRFGDALVDHRTYAFCGDGCLMEGVAQEAISLAGHLRLSKLTLVFDDNATTIDGPTSVSTSEDHVRRFEAAGWAAIRVDGHDQDAIADGFAFARTSERPTLIAARTRIGFGAPSKEGTSAAHGAPLGAAEVEGLRARLGWTAAPFDVPADVLDAWRAAGRRGAAEREAWQKRLEARDPVERAEFERQVEGRLPEGMAKAVAAEVAAVIAAPVNEPVRRSSQHACGVLAGMMPEIVGGSADLTGSVLSMAEGMRHVTPRDFSGSHVSYGIREHAMAAIMNGMAAHGGVRPYAGTYLTFSDYCRPSIRLAALMQLNVVFLFSHDSIGVGEDGPTHQPVEQLASLRAVPGLRVYRPADRVEALECWFDAVSRPGPSVMVVARQATEQGRTTRREDMPATRGGYVISASAGLRDATLLATGTEVALALDVQKRLKEEGLEISVVSLPCWRTFDMQDDWYRRQVLGNAPRFSIEAGARFGWARYVGDESHAFGVDDFGASAPASELYRRAGLTAEAIAEAVAVRLRSHGREPLAEVSC